MWCDGYERQQVHRMRIVLNPGLPAAQSDSFDSDEDANDPIEDDHMHEHHVIFACSGYVNARQLFPNLFRTKSQRNNFNCWLAQSQSFSQGSHMD